MILTTKTYVALNRITLSDPNASLRTVGYTENGEPILKKKSRSILPGTLIDLDGALAAELLGHHAIREATQGELLVGRVEGGDQ